MLSILREYLQTTSLHGFGRIQNERSTWSKAFWVTISLAAMSMLFTYSAEVLKEYYTYPTIVNTEISNDPPLFPAVTFCNLRPHDVYTIVDILMDKDENWRWIYGNFSYTGRPNATALERNAVNYENTVVAYSWIFELLKQYAGKEYPYQLDWQLRKIIYDRHVRNANVYPRNVHTNTFVNGSTLASEFIMKCTYNGLECSWRDFRPMVDPSYLNCYTFDPSLQNRQAGYTMAGPGSGLNVLLFVPSITSLNLSVATMSAFAMAPDIKYGGEGVRTALHPQDTQPMMGYEGRDVSRGTSTSFGVEVDRQVRMSKPYGTCSDIANYVVPPNCTQSYNLCIQLCIQNLIVEQCGCYDYGLPYNVQNSSNITSCQKLDSVPTECQTSKGLRTNSACISIVVSWVSRMGCMKNITESTTNVQKVEACRCSHSCEEIMYTTTSSQSSWPFYEQAQVILQDIMGGSEFSERFPPDKLATYFPGFNGTYVTWNLAQSQMGENNFMRINVYVSRPCVTVFTEKPAVTTVALLSNIGGQLGLWLGMSVISCAEVLQFLAEAMYYLLCKLHPVKGVADHRSSAQNNDDGNDDRKRETCYDSAFTYNKARHQ